MAVNRRDFFRLLGCAGSAGLLDACSRGQNGADPYASQPFGNARLLHFTDSHAQLLPVYFREPNVNIGLEDARGRLPHLVGQYLLEAVGIPAGSREAHALTYLDFASAAESFGRVGGFAYLKTLVDDMRAEVGSGNTLLLDGGDTWQGSATALWTKGEDMVGACNLLGVDVMTGHWEFTHGDVQFLRNVSAFDGEFLAQNIRVTEEALFDGAEVYDEDSGHAFRPYTIREVGGWKIAVIGQAFPYTPIANPRRFVPDWTFGIREQELQELLDSLRSVEKPDAVVLLSHNGMDVDLKLAGRVSGLDAILGGHTHDGVPEPLIVANPGGKTVVTNAGSNGKFLAVLDLDIGRGGVRDFRYRLLPVFSDLLTPDAEMQRYVEDVRRPFLERLREPLATTDSLLYRRGNFGGTFDQLICDALIEASDAQISLSPGFRWGTSILPGDVVTMERVMDQTAISYPETYVREMSGAEIKIVLESVADNLFHPDPYYQQGGDMVRVGGMTFSCDPTATMNARIGDLSTDDGRPIDAGRSYKVAGWATTGSASTGRPVWEIVADYLKGRKTLSVKHTRLPVLKNVADNPGIADYAGRLE